VSDKKKTTMLDLVGSPSFNYTAAADALNTAEAIRVTKKTKKDVVELDRREKIHRALQRFGLATAGASIASPVTAPVTEIAGGIADLTDGVLYSLEGEHGNAALSYASILPVVGAAVAAKRGMKLAEESGEKLIDVYHGFESQFIKHNVITEGGQKFAVGRQHRFFKQLDDVQLEYIFQRVVPNPEDGMNLFRRYKKTGEIPLSLTDIQRRVGPKQYKEMGYSRAKYIDDLYDANYSGRYADFTYSRQAGTGNTIENIRRTKTEPGFIPIKEDTLPTDYFGRNDLYGRAKEIPKNPFNEFVQPTKFYDYTKVSQEYTTPRMVWASTNFKEASSYGDQVLHFKVPKSYLRKQIQNRKLRGNDNMFVKEFSDELDFKFTSYKEGGTSVGLDGQLRSRKYPITGSKLNSDSFKMKENASPGMINEMILDEGLPMKFLYRKIKDK